MRYRLNSKNMLGVSGLQALALSLALLFTAIPTNSSDQKKNMTPSPKNKCTLENFRRLQKNMDIDKVLKDFGKPHRDLGSGIHIYEYILEDRSKVWVGCVSKVIYVDHVEGDKHTRIVGDPLPTSN